MRQVVRQNIHAPYSLHDMYVTALEISGDSIVLRMQSGMVKTTAPYSQPEGHVEFHDVRWDYSYAYLLNFTGNVGPFAGEKLFLRDFILRHPEPNLCIMDETYGYNCTKYTGYITIGGSFYECMLEIYHEGDMVFVEETDYSGMREVILSHDSEAKLYLVPAEVAENLGEYCWEFAAEWVWHGPENGRFLRDTGNGQYGVLFGADDFIDYLNRWRFPDNPSSLIKGLGCYNYELPEQYQTLPQYNF